MTCLLQRFLPLFGLVLLSLVPHSARAAGSTAVALWEPRAHDVFVVDVSRNEGYLVHEDGDYVTFPVATGRRSYVYYIGRGYKANTPIRTWTAEQKQIKGDRHTFGVSGRFIRLYRGGEDSPYGIHSYYKENDWMEAEGRYFSMGCVIVSEGMMDVIEKTFDVNGRKMTVITTDNLEATFAKVKAQNTLAARQ